MSSVTFSTRCSCKPTMTTFACDLCITTHGSKSQQNISTRAKRAPKAPDVLLPKDEFYSQVETASNTETKKRLRKKDRNNGHEDSAVLTFLFRVTPLLELLTRS
eukprot:2837057-Amphidinium_carterae.1